MYMMILSYIIVPSHTQVECMVILLLIVCNGTGLAVEDWNFEMVNGDDCNTQGLRT